MSLKQRSSFVLFMHRFVPVLTVLLAVFSILAINLRSTPVAVAATNSTINFQARLQSASGAIVPDGNYNIQFKLYGAASGGTALWTENYYNNASQGARTVNGYFNVKLGSVTAFPSTINWDQELWLTMNVGGTTTGTPSLDGEMDPRLKLTAVPYALSAGQLQTTDGSNTSKLSIQAPTGGNQVFQIQDQGAAGTYNILTAPSGSDGYVKLQGGTPGTQQSGNLNISGTGIFATGLSTAQLTATGQSILGGGSNQTQVIIRANASQSGSNPLLVLQTSGGTEVARITSDSSGNFYAGYIAGGTTSSGVANTAVGSNVLSSLTTGNYNTATGSEALLRVTSGSNNIGLGANAGGNITDGIGNVAIGSVALGTNAHGWNNVGIGYGADVGSDSIDNSTAIGTYSLVTQDNSLVLGCVAGNGSCGVSTKIAIGNTAPAGLFSVGSSSQFQVDIDGNFKTTGGTGLIKTTDTNAFQIQNSSADNIFNADSSDRKITIGDATNGGVLVNYGATLNAAKALSDFASDGAIGTAAATVDTHTSFTINQTTANRTLTIPDPTDTTAGRIIYIANIGTADVTVGGTAISSGNNAMFVWNGSAWGNALASGGGGGGSYVTLQGSTPGTADTGNLNISGTATFGTAANTGDLTATGQTILGGATDQTQVVIKANSSQSDSNPLLEFQNSDGSEKARISISNNGDFFLGWLSGSALSGGYGSNTGIGNGALMGVTSGGYNTAIGTNTLANLTTGGNNIAVGTAAAANLTADNNIAIGVSSLYNAGDAYDTVAIGRGAGWAIGSGTTWGNTFLGYNTGSQDDDGFATVATLHNAAAIGNQAQVQANDTIVLGGIGSAQAKVVIGSTMGTGSNLFGVSPVIDRTGTASQSGSTVTGSGTSWTTSGVKVGMRLIFADGTDGGTITAIGSDTSLTVNTSQTVSSQAYRIHNIGFQVKNTGDAYVQSTSTSAFSIQDANATNLFNADTSTGTITLGNSASGNYITFTAAGGLTAYGTSQHSKSVVLSPEYTGAVFDAASDSACSSANSGTLTSAYDATNYRNYYNWTSTSGSSQCYDVVVDVVLPNDFSSWASSDPINLQALASNTSNAGYAIAIRNVTRTAWDGNYGSSYASPGSISTSWSDVASSGFSGTYNAGDHLSIKIRMTAKSSANLKLGNLTLNYNSKW